MSDVDGPGDSPSQGEREDQPELDVDAAFAALVAGFSTPTPHGIGPWPASEDLDDDAPAEPDHESPPTDLTVEPPADTGRSGPPIRRIVLSEAAFPAGSAPEELDEDDEDADRFVPPEPPPLPRGDLISRLAWGAVIGGPVFLLLAALLWRTLPAMLLVTALLAFVAGFVVLVARMPPDHPDQHDDGAVV